MAYIIQNGGNGYSRADFVSAIDGKQDALQSGVNIKTVNGQSVLGSGNIEVSAREYSYDLTQEERNVVNDVKTLLSKYNPNNEFITFGFITDTHIMPTKAQMQTQTDVEEVVAAIQSQGITLESVESGQTIAEQIRNTWPTSDTSYYGASAESEIKMIGAIGYEYGLDLIIHGGDISSGRLPYNCYAYMMEKVARLFDKYISVPHFVLEGNHDYKYDDDVSARTGTEWRKYLSRFNDTTGLEFEYVKDNLLAQNCATTNSVDISDYTAYSCELDKGGLNKLKFAVFSSYDNNGTWSAIARHFSLDLSGKENIGTWSGVIVGHIPPSNHLGAYIDRFFNATGASGDYANNQSCTLPKSHGGVKPKSFVASIFGHLHDSVYSRYTINTGVDYAPGIRVANSSNYSRTVPSAFSVFIFDTTNWWLYEIVAENNRRTSTTFTEGVYENTDNLDNAWCYRYKLSHN